MARLFEYRGKRFLKDARIAIPAGEIATTDKRIKLVQPVADE